MTPRLRWIIVTAALIATAACRPAGTHHIGPDASAGTTPLPGAVDRGAVLYTAYCGGCHGAKADGRGPFADVLDLRAADLRAPAVQAASEGELLERIMGGAPLGVTPRSSTPPEAHSVEAIARYLPVLATSDWEFLSAGRLVFEGACAACHGAYGHGEGVLALWLGVPDLMAARERYTDAALAGISHAGIGTMPPLSGSFDPGEVRALIAYIRHLSEGFRLYDTYCAACHGDDGQGLYSEDLLPPATAAPPLRAPFSRPQILHMLRREQGVMPHFRGTLSESQVRDVVAYMRTVPAQNRQPR